MDPLKRVGGVQVKGMTAPTTCRRFRTGHSATRMVKRAADDSRVLIPFCVLVLFCNEGVLSKTSVTS